MGGPKAWRQAQQRQQEFLAKFNEEPPPQVDSDEQAGDVEKRDLYAEYGVEPETENEREARGGNDVADDDPEDVSASKDLDWIPL
jgi:Swi5-dependent recombination DNA repair protein 1